MSNSKLKFGVSSMSMTPSSVLAMLAENNSDSVIDEQETSGSGEVLSFLLENQYSMLGEEITGNIFFRTSKTFPNKLRICLKLSGDLVLTVIKENPKAQMIMRVPQNSPKNEDSFSQQSPKSRFEMAHHSIVIPAFSQSITAFTFTRKIRTNTLHMIPVRLRIRKDLLPSSHINLLNPSNSAKEFITIGSGIQLISVALKYSVSLSLSKRDSIVELDSSIGTHVYFAKNESIEYPIYSKPKTINLDSIYSNERPFSLKSFFQNCCSPSSSFAHPLFTELESSGISNKGAIRFERLSENRSQVVIVFPSWDIPLPKSVTFELFMHIKLKNSVSTHKVLDFPIKMIQSKPFVYNYVLSQSSEIKLPPIDLPDFFVSYESIIKLVSSKNVEYTILKESPSDVEPLFDSAKLNSKSEFEFSSSFSQNSIFHNKQQLECIMLPPVNVDLSKVPAFQAK